MSNKYEELFTRADDWYEIVRTDTGEFYGGGPFETQRDAEQEVESIIKDYENWNDVRPYPFDPHTQLEVIKLVISYEKI
jgi:hypothetical protein